MAEELDSLSHSFTVAAPPEHAFYVFTEGFSTWYPAEYSWSGARLEWIGFEPHEGGHCFEVGPLGFRCDWGRVLEWQPPRSLRLSWQISFERVPVPDPDRASEILVRWQVDADGRTEVEFEHRYFSRHGDNWREYRAAMASENGWPYILQRYAESVRRS